MRLFLALNLFSTFLSAQLWVQLPDFPGTKRDDGVAVIVNNKAYFGTGLQEWNATIDFYALDLGSRTWSNIPFMPHTTERQYACAFAGTNSFYVFGGDGQGGALKDLYKFNTLSNEWSALAAKPGKGLLASVCFSFGDKVIIAAGKYGDGKLSKEVWEYTISTDTWLQKADLPFSPRWRASSCSENNFGYLLFGIDSNNVRRKELYKYDPSNDSWLFISNFPAAQGRAYAAMHGFNGRVFVFGGHDSLNVYHNDSWYFNVSTLSWFQGPDLPSIGRRGGMSCGTGQDFYFTCGLSASGRLTETWSSDLPLSIHETKTKLLLRPFPNPCDEVLRVRLPFEKPELRYDVYSATGALVLYSNKQQSGTDLEINTNEFEPGIYFLKVYTGSEFFAGARFIKE